MTNFGPQYVAGFFDGEGSVFIVKQKRAYGPYYHLRVNIAQTGSDSKLLGWLEDEFGGSLGYYSKKKQNGQDCWYWTATGKVAIKFLTWIKDYTYYKTEQIEFALEFEKFRRDWSDSRLESGRQHLKDLKFA